MWKSKLHLLLVFTTILSCQNRKPVSVTTLRPPEEIFAPLIHVPVPEYGNTKRTAILIGINQYSGNSEGGAPIARGRKWSDLKGAVNDVAVMRQLLVGRFGFKPQDVTCLLNRDATRKNILDMLDSLATRAQAGEVVFVYYAGHGSQVRNSLSKEPDQMDETWVPADAIHGASDIRDKELAVYFNKILDRGVYLTVIVDSCHSGSVLRGRANRGAVRKLERMSGDAADASEPPDPEKRALVMNAARNDQSAHEIQDENGNYRGVFSLTLSRVLTEMPITASAESIHLRVQAIMSVKGSQNPGMAASKEREKKPLFADIKVGTPTGDMLFPIIWAEQNRFKIQGGSSLGVGVGTIFQGTGEHTHIRLIVTDSTLTYAWAVREKPSQDRIRDGDLFKIASWKVPHEEALALFVPKSSLSQTALLRDIQAVKRICDKQGVKWSHPGSRDTAKMLMYWEDNGGWHIRWQGGFRNIGSGGELVQETNLGAIIKEICTKDCSLHMEIPAPESISKTIEVLLSEEGFEPITKGSSADYCLLGKLSDSRLEYVWSRNCFSPQEYYESIPPQYELPQLPETTDAVHFGSDTDESHVEREAMKLVDMAKRLTRARAWLLLRSPADNGSFPYRLAFQSISSGKITSEGPFEENEVYYPVLVADMHAFEKAITQRYVYIFAIDSTGESTLLFPKPSQGSVDNCFPSIDENAAIKKEPLIPLKDNSFRVSPPFGSDTYILFSSATPIRRDAFEFKGVRNNTRLTSGLTGLSWLVRSIQSSIRGDSYVVPPTWSIERLNIISTPRTAPK